jgi:hypothetical protein
MDLAKFLNESLSSRTATVEVPELKSFFGKDKPEWLIKGLTAAELGRANLAADKGQENLKALVEAMAGTGDKVQALRKTMGISEEEIPADVSRRIELLVAGSVEPKLGQDSRDVAVKLAETFPTVFYNLTNQILSLTGQGAEVGKRKPSGKTAKSGQ